MDAYFTVAHPGEGVYEEKKSRFLGFVRPVLTERDALQFVSEVKAAHPQARHHVFAYTIDSGTRERLNDDGEPQGTGGARVMDAIKKAGVTNVCLVVVRYFGGTLLGAGPLARAYSAASAAALDNAGKAKYESCGVYRLVLPYSLQSRVEQELKKRRAGILDSAFSERVTLEFSVRLLDAPLLIGALTELSAGALKPELIEERFCPTDD